MDQQRFSLRRDERGAIMLLGVFMAIFLAAVLFYLVGIGQSVIYRQRMQDAADAAAMAAAVVHAKGMNILVLINLAMAALLAVLVALRLMATLSLAMVGLCLAVLSWPPLTPLAVPCAKIGADLAVKAEQAFQRARPKVIQGLRGLHAAARAVRDATPALAELRALDTVHHHYRPPATAAIVVPPRLTLPTRDGSFTTLCGQAGRFAGEVATLPFAEALATLGAGKAGDTLMDGVSDVAANLTQGSPEWFCGMPGASPPKLTRTLDKQLPVLQSTAACQQALEDPRLRRTSGATCQQATADIHAADPQPATGACQTRCDAQGPYAQRARQARQECHPQRSDRLRGFMWQEQWVTRRLEQRGGAWVQVAVTAMATPRLLQTDAPPCPASAWNSADPWSTDPPTPLCVEEGPLMVGRDGRFAERRDRTVTQVFACIRPEQVALQPTADGGLRPADAGSALPQALEDDAVIGADMFQLRAVAAGETPNELPARWVQMASRRPGNSTWKRTLTLGRAAIAQAEYYFPAGPKQRDQMLWEMKWAARLRRFRLPDKSSASQSAFTKACAGFEACQLLGDPAHLSELVVH